MCFFFPRMYKNGWWGKKKTKTGCNLSVPAFRICVPQWMRRKRKQVKFFSSEGLSLKRGACY